MTGRGPGDASGEGQEGGPGGRGGRRPLPLLLTRRHLQALPRRHFLLGWARPQEAPDEVSRRQDVSGEAETATRQGTQYRT